MHSTENRSVIGEASVAFHKRSLVAQRDTFMRTEGQEIGSKEVPCMRVRYSRLADMRALLVVLVVLACEPNKQPTSQPPSILSFAPLARSRLLEGPLHGHRAFYCRPPSNISRSVYFQFLVLAAIVSSVVFRAQDGR
jgi:hypothetical protein